MPKSTSFGDFGAGRSPLREGPGERAGACSEDTGFALESGGASGRSVTDMVCPVSVGSRRGPRDAASGSTARAIELAAGDGLAARAPAAAGGPKRPTVAVATTAITPETAAKASTAMADRERMSCLAPRSDRVNGDCVVVR